MRLAIKNGGKSVTGVRKPLVRDFDELPLIRGKRGAPQVTVTPQRIHELEMEAELERSEVLGFERRDRKGRRVVTDVAATDRGPGRETGAGPR